MPLILASNEVTHIEQIFSTKKWHRCSSFNYFQASTISTYDFSTLYTTLPHNLIRNQLVDLIENTCRREEALYLTCNEERAFFASEEHKKI